MSELINPFDITFGREPLSLIYRENESKEIIDCFSSIKPATNIYVISGSRGSGKTVLLTSISNAFREKEDWLIIEINPETEILEQLASKLFDQAKLKKLFLNTEFNFSFKGFAFSISGEKPVSNVSSLLKLELEYLKKKKIKVLITIDEISSNENTKVFAHEFQLFLRNNYDVFLLMTGLYSNLYKFENEKTLTFLNRAPKLFLKHLNLKSIVNSYKNIFKVDEKNAIELAKLTNGYAFAYQVLGYLLIKNKTTTINSDILDQFDEILQERSYSLIFRELTKKEIQIIKSVIKSNLSVNIEKDINIKKNQLSNYKKILINKGIIEDNKRGVFVFKLPRFENYIKFLIDLEEI